MKMKKQYGCKKDANHKEIINIFKEKNITFFDLSDIGRGVPDGIAWIKDRWEFIEIKNLKTAYGRRGLNKNQKKWIEQWNGGGVYVLHNIEEALQLINGNLEKLTYIQSKSST